MVCTEIKMKLEPIIKQHFKEVLSIPGVTGMDMLRAVNLWLGYDDLTAAEDYDKCMARISSVLELMKEEYS
jgi:hypothetical protein